MFSLREQDLPLGCFRAASFPMAFPPKRVARKPVWSEVRAMGKNILIIALVLGAGGYFAYGALGAGANDAALEVASQAENRISLAVTGMT